MKRHENEKLTDQTLKLDDNEYINCSFRNCVFLYGGGPFEIMPFTTNGIQIKLEGAALNTSNLIGIIQGAKAKTIPVGSQMIVGGARFVRMPDPTLPIT